MEYLVYSSAGYKVETVDSVELMGILIEIFGEEYIEHFYESYRNWIESDALEEGIEFEPNERVFNIDLKLCEKKYGKVNTPAEIIDICIGSWADEFVESSGGKFYDDNGVLWTVEKI